MRNSIISELAETIDIWDLLSYLSQSGWVLEDDETSQFIVFYGPEDAYNNPVEIVFLRRPDAPEQSIYISNALEILSAVTDIAPIHLSYDINSVNKDVLRVRIEGALFRNAIPLKSAAQHINDLKQLVTYQ